MTALLTADEAARLTLGVNVIVRPGDLCVDEGHPDGYECPPGCPGVNAPQDWVALTGPCPTCDGEGRTMGYGITHPCERCNGTGRRIVPLFTECPDVMREAWDHASHLNLGICDGSGRVLLGRASIEVIPVTAKDIYGEPPDAYIYVLRDGRAFLCRGESEQPLALDPLPVPGRDFGIIIDCVELA